MKVCNVDFCCFGESYVDFPDWIKRKKVTINPVNVMINALQQSHYIMKKLEKIQEEYQK